MRSPREMMAVILGYARRDSRVRAVYMNGSRINPNVKPDIFQDFDIVYIVTEIEPFIRDKAWLKTFGEMLIMQLPDEIDRVLGKETSNNHYAFLMQLSDGNRIDLTIQTPDTLPDSYKSDSLTYPLLDKDGILPVMPPPNDSDYLVKRPSQALFDACVNEFWWVSLYVAKGLWRGELLYAMRHLNQIVRDELIKMLTWHAGYLTDFEVSAGKCSKNIENLLPKELWQRLCATFPSADYNSVWEALEGTTELFADVSETVASELGLVYSDREAKPCTAYIKHVRTLPRDAAGIY